MTTNTQRAERWFGRKLGLTDRANLAGRGSVYGDERAVYSYGSHFPMVEAYGPEGKPNLFLLNGDRWSTTTSGHQSMVRTLTNRYASKCGAAIMLVPFSVLRLAGIDHASIRPVEVSEDRWHETEHTSADLAGVPESHRQSYCYLPYGAAECQHGSTQGHTVNLKPGPDGLYRWTTGEHLLGESVFSAFTTVDIGGCLGPDQGDNGVTDERCEHGRLWAHKLTRTVRRYYLSGFDSTGRGWRGLYFLAELPRKVSGIADARDALLPAPLRAGGTYVRQGDVFAVPAPEVTTRKLRPQTRAGWCVGPAAVCQTCGYTVRAIRPWGIIVRPLPDGYSAYHADGTPHVVACRHGLAEPHETIERDGTLLGTRHTATETRTRGPRTYARGFLRHTAGDHRRVKLPDGWNLILRSAQRRAWSIPAGRSGGVD